MSRHQYNVKVLTSPEQKWCAESQMNVNGKIKKIIVLCCIAEKKLFAFENCKFMLSAEEFDHEEKL